MKNTYETPVLQVLGSVESLTEAFGNQAIVDTYTYNGTPQQGHGSANGIVVQSPPPR